VRVAQRSHTGKPLRYKAYLHASSSMDDMIQDAWTFLAIKLVSVPVFIWTVSVVGRRWGPSLGGLIIGLPLTSGPVLFFLALEQGNNFASAASQGALMGLVSLSTSCLVYSRLSFGLSWSSSLGVA
jgi:hypothetical protein